MEPRGWRATCPPLRPMPDPRRARFRGITLAFALACAALATATTTTPASAEKRSAPLLMKALRAAATAHLAGPAHLVRAASDDKGLHLILARTPRGRFQVFHGPAQKLERLAIHGVFLESAGITVATHE